MTRYFKTTLYSCLAGFVIFFYSLKWVAELVDEATQEGLQEETFLLRVKYQQMDFDKWHQQQRYEDIGLTNFNGWTCTSNNTPQPIKRVLKPSSSKPVVIWATNTVDVVGDQVEEIRYKGKVIWRK